MTDYNAGVNNIDFESGGINIGLKENALLFQICDLFDIIPLE